MLMRKKEKIVIKKKEFNCDLDETNNENSKGSI